MSAVSEKRWRESTNFLSHFAPSMFPFQNNEHQTQHLMSLLNQRHVNVHLHHITSAEKWQFESTIAVRQKQMRTYWCLLCNSHVIERYLHGLFCGAMCLEVHSPVLPFFKSNFQLSVDRFVCKIYLYIKSWIWFIQLCFTILKDVWLL